MPFASGHKRLAPNPPQVAIGKAFAKGKEKVLWDFDREKFVGVGLFEIILAQK